MTDQQKEAIKILNRVKGSVLLGGTAVIDDDEYFALMEFIVEKQTEIHYVPQPTIPGITPDIRPYYGDNGDIKPPYHVTCGRENISTDSITP